MGGGAGGVLGGRDGGVTPEMGGARDLEEAHGYPDPANVRVEMAAASYVARYGTDTRSNRRGVAAMAGGCRG